MKALLVTLTNYERYNYGNSLQMYAASHILTTRFGLETDVLCCEKTHRIRMSNLLVRTIHRVTGYRFSADKVYWRTMGRRHARFRAFNRTRLHMRYERDLNRLDGYDYYVVGSDQVWNYEFFQVEALYAQVFMLDFVKAGKRVCMMPSFGVSTISDQWRKYFSEKLKAFPALSVREERGAELVRELTGRHAEVLVDPTLLLDQNDWAQVEAKPAEIDTDTPYLLSYFLGEKQSQVREEIHRLAAKRSLRVLSFDDDLKNGVRGAGPEEFLYLIHHAAMVVTNSFHGSVFSFIFERPFAVFERAGMMSRIDTLLSSFAMENRLVHGCIPEELEQADYAEGKRRLAIQQKRAMAFLSDSIRG